MLPSDSYTCRTGSLPPGLRSFFVFALLVFTVAGCKSHSKIIWKKFPKAVSEDRLVVVVIDFADSPETPGSGRWVAEALARETSGRIKPWQVRYGEDLAGLIQSEGIIIKAGDLTDIHRLQKKTGMDLIVSGTVKKYTLTPSSLENSHLTFEFRAVNVHTSELIAAGMFNRKSRKSDKELLDIAAQEIASKIEQAYNKRGAR